MKSIKRAFTIFLRRKYEPMAMDEKCVAYIAEAGQRALLTAWRDMLVERYVGTPHLTGGITHCREKRREE